MLPPPPSPSLQHYKNKNKDSISFLYRAVHVGEGSPSGQAEALIVVNGLRQSCVQGFFTAVHGEVKKVVARVGHRQIFFPTGGRLDDNAQTRHAIDRDAVATCKKH